MDYIADGKRIQATAGALIFGEDNAVGKGVIEPTLSEWEGPAIVIDGWGRTQMATEKRRRRLGPVAVFEPDMGTGSINPLNVLPSTSDDASGEACLRMASHLTERHCKNAGYLDDWVDGVRDLTAMFLMAATQIEEVDGRTVSYVRREMSAGTRHLPSLFDGMSRLGLGGRVSAEIAERLKRFPPEADLYGVHGLAMSALDWSLQQNMAGATSGRDQIDIERLVAESGTLYLRLSIEACCKHPGYAWSVLESVVERVSAAAGALPSDAPPVLVTGCDLQVLGRIPFIRNAGALPANVKPLLGFRRGSAFEIAVGEENADAIRSAAPIRLHGYVEEPKQINWQQVIAGV